MSDGHKCQSDVEVSVNFFLMVMMDFVNGTEEIVLDLRLIQIKLFQRYIIGIIESIYDGVVFCNCLSALLSVSLANAPSFDTTCSRET
jgi:hypothetical protein